MDAPVLPKTDADENEGEIELAGEDDFEVYTGEADHLGGHEPEEPRNDAESNQKIGNIRLRKSSIGAVITEIAWGQYRGEAACCIQMQLRFRASDGFRIKYAGVACTVVPLEDGNGKKIDGEWPKIRRYGPIPSKDGQQTQRDPGVEVQNRLELAPTVDALGLSLGSLSRQSTYHPITGYDFSADPNFDDDTVTWSVKNRNAKNLRLDHDFDMELLVAHGGKDFCTEFEVDARLDFRWRILTVDSSKVMTRKRVFRVLPSIVELR